MTGTHKALPPVISLLLFGACALLAYRSWSAYPNLIPTQRSVRRIRQFARRKGIPADEAYRLWADRRLKRTRFGYLARDVFQ